MNRITMAILSVLLAACNSNDAITYARTLEPTATCFSILKGKHTDYAICTIGSVDWYCVSRADDSTTGTCFELSRQQIKYGRITNTPEATK